MEFFLSTQAFPSLTPQTKHKVLKQREREVPIYTLQENSPKQTYQLERANIYVIIC